MIQLTHFHTVQTKITKRIAHCKNCMFTNDGEPGKRKFNKGEKRIVVTMSFGPAERNVSLCMDCAAHEADQLATLANRIRLELSIAREERQSLRLIQGGAA